MVNKTKKKNKKSMKSMIAVDLKTAHRFKEMFNVHPRESYNDIMRRAIIDGELHPSDPNEDEGDALLLSEIEEEVKA